MIAVQHEMDRGRRRRELRALLVDDDPTTSELHRDRLVKQGYEVSSCASAEAALEVARRSPPDVIFVHLRLGGAAFIHGLRADDQTRHVPVVMLSKLYDPKLQKLGLTTRPDGSW